MLRLECSTDCISGSVGHHQCYINWSSAQHPSYIQTFMRILTAFGIQINFNDNWVSGSSPKSFSVHFLTMSAYPHFEKIIFKKNKIIINNCVSGSPPMLYKLVLGPTPILHTNVDWNPLTTFGISRYFKII